MGVRRLALFEGWFTSVWPADGNLCEGTPSPTGIRQSGRRGHVVIEQKFGLLTARLRSVGQRGRAAPGKSRGNFLGNSAMLLFAWIVSLQFVLAARSKANMESYLASSQPESRAVEEYTAQTPPPSGNDPNVKLTVPVRGFSAHLFISSSCQRLRYS